MTFIWKLSARIGLGRFRPKRKLRSNCTWECCHSYSLFLLTPDLAVIIHLPSHFMSQSASCLSDVPRPPHFALHPWLSCLPTFSESGQTRYRFLYEAGYIFARTLIRRAPRVNLPSTPCDRRLQCSMGLNQQRTFLHRYHSVIGGEDKAPIR